MACGPAARTNIDGCLVTPWQLLQSCSASCGAGKLRTEVRGYRCVLENCWLPSNSTWREMVLSSMRKGCSVLLSTGKWWIAVASLPTTGMLRGGEGMTGCQGSSCKPLLSVKKNVPLGFSHAVQPPYGSLRYFFKGHGIQSVFIFRFLLTRKDCGQFFSSHFKAARRNPVTCRGRRSGTGGYWEFWNPTRIARCFKRSASAWSLPAWMLGPDRNFFWIWPFSLLHPSFRWPDLRNGSIINCGWQNPSPSSLVGKTSLLVAYIRPTPYKVGWNFPWRLPRPRWRVGRWNPWSLCKMNPWNCRSLGRTSATGRMLNRV